MNLKKTGKRSLSFFLSLLLIISLFIIGAVGVVNASAEAPLNTSTLVSVTANCD